MISARLRSTVAISAGIALCTFGCSRSTDLAAKNSAVEQPGATVVRWVKVVEQDIPEKLDLTAKVQPDPTKVIRIFPPASGRVIAVEVKPGDYVQRGQVVAILSSSDAASAQSDFAKANIEADRATRTLERQKSLFEHGAVAQKDYIDARAQAEEARAELARAKQRLDLLNLSPSATTDRVTLVSPASGIVTDVSAAPGEFSKSLESSNPLITIADLDTVWIVGDVYEKDIARVSRGKDVTVTLQAYPDKQWNGRIDSVSGTLDPTTRTLKARVTLSNPGQRLKPEMFGAMHVDVGVHRAIVLPVAAIVREGSAATVFVKNADKPEQRTVKVGETVDGQVEILTGVKAGEEVAADGAELLKGGPSQ